MTSISAQFMQVWRVAWMGIATVATLAVVTMLLWPPAPRKASSKSQEEKAPDAAQLDSSSNIVIAAGSSLLQKLTTSVIQPESVSFPVLHVSGSIVARLVGGKSRVEDRWQFSSPDVSMTYSDWMKSQTEIENAEKQLTTIKGLAESNIHRYEKLVDRLKKLVANGTEAPKDLSTAESDLAQAQFQAQQNITAAENTLKLARKNRVLLERQLQQAGLDAEIFDKPEEESVFLIANVPESQMDQVQAGQACEAQLFAVPGKKFVGHVEKMSSTVSSERRALRVLFHLTDPEEHLKPGMYAEVGLGTDARKALLVPAEAMLHVGSLDYLLVDAGGGKWRIAECKAGESHGDRIEIATGLKPGDRIITQGAILLKPLVVLAKDK
ncbi:MAG: efflux RND transporter periplasmic adaptor subunit [Planctomycetales bacterium]|nr:efflux RND transporter periplasmic adaptor subunit [Planctomycetales bacterium]